MTLHSAYSVKYNTTVLAGLTNLDLQTNPEVAAEVGIGSQFPQFAVVRNVKPRIAFNTRGVAGALTVTGSAGAALSDVNTLIASYVELSDGAPTTTTVDYTMTRGLLLPRRLSARHAQDATLDLECLAYSTDGATSPVAVASGTAATLTRDNIRHTLKSATVAGVDLGCITDVSIDFGINADTLGCKSDLYHKHITKEGGITPTVSITTYDAAQLSALTVNGKYGTHANTTITLRQYDNTDVGFAADYDIVMTMAGHVSVRNHTGNGPGTSQATIQITGVWDGTNAPIGITIQDGTP